MNNKKEDIIIMIISIVAWTTVGLFIIYNLI
jgi:hypothetical protein